MKSPKARFCAASIVAFMVFAGLADVTWSGSVSISAGADVTCSDLSAITSLTMGEGSIVRFDTADAPAFDISGSGTIVKASGGEWTLNTPIVDFAGDFEISSGVVTATAAGVLGKDDEKFKVHVKDGATLVLPSADSQILKRHVHIAGAGASSRNGALEMPALSLTGHVLNHICLDADATLYTPKNGLFFLRGSLDLAGHRLTVKGGGSPTILHGCVVSETGEIYLQSSDTDGPVLCLRGPDHGIPSWGITPSEDPFVMTGNMTMQLWGSLMPVNRPLWVSGSNNSLIHTSNGPYIDAEESRLDHANWAGAIVFTNETGLSGLSIKNNHGTADKPCMFVVSGQISGNGNVDISVGGGNDNGTVSNRVAILNTNNTYTGSTTINNNNAVRSTLLGHPGAIPGADFTSVTVKSGFVDLAAGDDGSRWNYDDVLRFVDEATFLNSSRVRLTGELAADGVGAMSFQVGEDTPADVELEAKGAVGFMGADNETPIPFRWRGGVARFTGAQPALLGDVTLFADEGGSSSIVLDGADITLYETNTIYLGQGYSAPVRLVVTNSVLRTSNVLKNDFYTGYENPDWGGPSRGGAIFAGLYSPAMLEVLDGAVITNRVIVSGFLPGGTGYGGKQGAVYQRGGHVVALGATKAHHTSCLGLSSADSASGYYELSGGTLEARGRFVIGGYGYGCFVQYGGSVIATNGLSAAPNTKQQNLLMATCNGGSGMLYIKKGTWDVFTSDIYLGQGSTALPTVDITLDGDEALFDLHDSPIYVADRSSCGVYSFNLNGGVLRCAGLRLNKNNRTDAAGNANDFTNNVLCVNFNGGTLRAGSYNRNLFGYHTDRRDLWSTNVVVYAGGATIDTDGHDGNMINSQVRGAWGKGVKSIRMANPPTGPDYVGALRVRIEGDGMGATAFVPFDSKKMELGEIVVTSPGYGYTTATATVYYGKKALDVDCTVELADNENTGSFTKSGPGDLTLNATNTWGGATVVDGGTLKAGCDWAIPSNSVVRIGGGGVLDLNGKAACIASIVYTAGGGTVANASAAELPAVPALAISLDDIRSGRPIEISGDLDVSASTLTVTGDDYSWLDDGVRRYDVLTVSDGALVGAPAFDVENPPPAHWRLVARSDGIRLCRVRGGVMVVR